MPLSDRQLRQRVSYGIARVENLIEEGEATRDHLILTRDALTERIDGEEAEVPPEEPEPGVEPFYEWDPNDYDDTAELLAANSNRDVMRCTLEAGQTLFDGSTGNVLRQTYPGDGSEGSTNYDLSIPGAAPETTAEVWIEFYVRFNEAWSMGGMGDDKTFFLLPNTGGRWELHYGLWSSRTYGGPDSILFIVSTGNSPWDVREEMWDGGWHRVRIRARMGSDAESRDGAFHWATDEHTHISDTVTDTEDKVGEPIVTGSNTGTHFANLRLGANAQPEGSGIRDFGRLRIYTDDPGWS